MPWEFYHDHLMKQNGSLNDVGKYLRLIGANNLEISVAGFLETSIEVCGQKLAASFLASDRHTTKSPSNRRDQCPVILGCNILRAIAHSFDCVEQSMKEKRLDSSSSLVSIR